jgi:hypothetical protein
VKTSLQMFAAMSKTEKQMVKDTITDQNWIELMNKVRREPKPTVSPQPLNPKKWARRSAVRLKKALEEGMR